MNLNKYLTILAILFLINTFTNGVVPIRKGWWKFDDSSNLTKAESGFGNSLVLVGNQYAATGPETGNGAVLIGPGSYYKMNHLISANGGGAKVNEYTLQFDFKIIQNGIWHCFFQTSTDNSDDGDLFINTSGNVGVGVVGYSNYSILPNEWYRLIVSVKNGTEFTFYLDGKQIEAGSIQSVDGRFSLSNPLLIFADNNAEDGSIYCSELSIWNQALTLQQVSELGGYNHNTYVEPSLSTRIPYLQSPGINSMNICWHDTALTNTRVEYGTDSNLGLIQTGTSEIISSPYRWHTVKMTGLQANTRYFYKVGSGTGESAIYSFKTLPGINETKKIRFVLLSDTHCPDTTMFGKIARAARSKIGQLYGSDVENHVNGILHSGDIVVSGNIPEQYTVDYFKPLSSLSPNLPTTVVAGNHEAENSTFYNYLKIDDISAFPANSELNEKIWNLRVGNSLFIGLNTNITNQYGTIMANWLDAKLSEVENVTGIDFVFLFFHHPPFSELWKSINNSDAGTVYVNNILFPIIKKYTKVQEMHYGHTHGFERGTIQSVLPNGDFRIVCGGGGGGALDPWSEGENQDFNDIHITISNYCYQILEIDPLLHSYQTTMYSLGTLSNPKNNIAMDTWYKKLNQTGPETPSIENYEIKNDSIEFSTSLFSGVDSLMSVQLQISSDFSFLVIGKDTVVHWEDVYGVDQYNNPLDLHRNIDLYKTKIHVLLNDLQEVYARVRYRDFNLKWSGWSAPILIHSTGMKNLKSEAESPLRNYPNPFKNNTTFNYNIPEDSEVSFRVFDLNYKLIENISEGFKLKGNHTFLYKTTGLSSGIYFCEVISSSFCATNKIIKTQ